MSVGGRRRLRVAALAGAAVLIAAAGPDAAQAPAAAHTRPRAAADRPATAARGTSAAAHTPAAAPRAPSGPPLAGPGAASAPFGVEASPGADASLSAPASGGDPLVANGLGSPSCAGASAAALSAASRRNCASSGFAAAAAPTGDYGLDVHIDTGPLGFTVATLEQDYLIAPIWMGLVWIVHTLVVALEWCFALDLLGGSLIGDVERSLQAAQGAFTRPWLVLTLALAAIGAAYDGLVRRRVAETLGQALLTLAMMGAGLWAIADPAGTVGTLGRWVDAASAGTLGAVVAGSPARAPRTLADSMGDLFAGVVGAPWCYLEFGDVRWCEEPAQLSGRLRAAGLRIAASGGAREAQSAALLRAARTNGELFLALPANGPVRNSINERGSLLSALCGGSSDATACRGPTASEAEFRTQGGTAARLGGLLLIALGALGLLLLFGFIALQLLGAELTGLVYLLLAPIAVLAPALGENGRAAFRAWGTRLLGAVTAKLLFSFLLGAVLLLTRALLTLPAFGWWTRWLLMSALWWSTYLQRGRALAALEGGWHPARRARAGGHVTRGHGSTATAAARYERIERIGSPSLARRAQRRLETPAALGRLARRMGAVGGGLVPEPVPVRPRPPRPREPRARHRAGTPDAGEHDAGEREAGAP